MICTICYKEHNGIASVCKKCASNFLMPMENISIMEEEYKKKDDELTIITCEFSGVQDYKKNVREFKCELCGETLYEIKSSSYVMPKCLDKDAKEIIVCGHCLSPMLKLSGIGQYYCSRRDAVRERGLVFHKKKAEELRKTCAICDSRCICIDGEFGYAWDAEGKFPICQHCETDYPTCIQCGCRHQLERCPSCGYEEAPRCSGRPFGKGYGRTIGIEIECNTPIKLQKNVAKWGYANLKNDGSLRGSESVEYTSPHPLYESNYKDWLDVLCKLIRPSKVYNRCGLHIHIGDKWSWYELTNILRYCKHWEHVFFSMVSPSRRPIGPNNSGSPMALSSVPRIYSRGQFFDWMYGKTNMNGRLSRRANDQNGPRYYGAVHRYRWINVHSYFNIGTIEIRLHQGTTNKRKIEMWTDLWLSLLPKISTGKVLNISPLELVHSDIRKYYTNRIQELSKIRRRDII